MSWHVGFALRVGVFHNCLGHHSLIPDTSHVSIFLVSFIPLSDILISSLSLALVFFISYSEWALQALIVVTYTHTCIHTFIHSWAFSVGQPIVFENEPPFLPIPSYHLQVPIPFISTLSFSFSPIYLSFPSFSFPSLFFFAQFPPPLQCNIQL